jgi:hypothetical protein
MAELMLAVFEWRCGQKSWAFLPVIGIGLGVLLEFVAGSTGLSSVCMLANQKMAYLELSGLIVSNGTNYFRDYTAIGSEIFQRKEIKNV